MVSGITPTPARSHFTKNHLRKAYTSICYLRMTDVNNIARRLKELRNRAGFSMAGVAHAIGMKGASSYQRYEHPDNYARKEYLPFDIAVRIGTLLDGKGRPPVTMNEVIELAGLDRASPADWEQKIEQADDAETEELIRLFRLIDKPLDRQRVLDLLRSIAGE